MLLPTLENAEKHERKQVSDKVKKKTLKAKKLAVEASPAAPQRPRLKIRAKTTQKIWH